MKKLRSFLRKQKKIDETEFDAISKFNYLNKIKNSSKKISSFLTIQEGCDKFCHFCVVPYTRGPEYSRSFSEILDEAKILTENGVREITLLGQNVNAYNYENYRLSDLILEIEKIPEIKRIRYTTSHPRDMTEDLINVYSISKKIMPLVHLPIQSASNKILKLMNRKHLVSDYVDIYEKLKKINPNIKFSSDFIIAYPGEEEEDFKATLELINNIKFINSYSFIFSPRPGTLAENLNPIDKKIALERLGKIQNLLFEHQVLMNKSLEGKEIEVLVENKTFKNNKFFGRSEYMTSVIFDGNDHDVGKVIKVKINASNQNTLFGESLNNLEKKSGIDLNNSIKKNFQSSLKFVYSENNSLSVIFQENDLLLGVAGEFNKNLKELEKITGANLHSRGNSIVIKSSSEKNEMIKNAIQFLSNQFINNGSIEQKDILSSVDQFMINEKVKNSNITDIIKTPKKSIIPRSEKQKDYVRALRQSEIIISAGPAGTGKTF